MWGGEHRNNFKLKNMEKKINYLRELLMECEMSAIKFDECKKLKFDECKKTLSDSLYRLSLEAAEIRFDFLIKNITNQLTN